MTQRYDQDMILGYVEGELIDGQRAAFEAVLEEDHELRQLVSQMKLDRQALRGLGIQSAPVGLIDQVIQGHERAALLGDPAAPEPLPLTMPGNRWKFRRVLAYSGIAAVLLLSFGLVFQTLLPPGLLDHQPQLAQNETGTGPSTDGLLDVGSGLALLDEDNAYDEVDARALARKNSVEKIERQDAPVPTPGYVIAEGSASGSKTIPQPLRAITSEPLVSSEDLKEATSKTTKSEPTTELSSVLAMKTSAAASLPVDDPSRTGFAGLVGTLDRAESEAISTLDDATTGRMLTQAKTPTETDRIESKKDAAVDAFAGYSDTPLTDQTQLLVKAASPTQAHRDIRNWAIGNSARVVQETLVREGIGGAVVGLRARRMSPVTATADEDRDAASTRLLIVVEEQQVPKLLAYLNRGQGQHAELVMQTPASGIFSQRLARPDNQGAQPTGASDATNAEGSQGIYGDTSVGADTTIADTNSPPKAVANRLVDTHVGWDHGSLAKGLTSPTPDTDKNKSRQAQQARTESDSRAKQQEQTPPKPKRQTFAFDWSRLLEPKQTSPIPAASAPLLESKTPAPLRLEIIIQQVADESPTGAGTDEPGRVDQEDSSVITE